MTDGSVGAPLGVLVFGRDARCDVPIDHPTVSTRHARLVWTKRGLVVEDLGSTNGTFVGAERVQSAAVARGADVRLGEVHLPWSDARVAAFLRQGGPSGTMVMPAVAKGAPTPARRDAAAIPRTPRTSPSWVRGVLGLLGGASIGFAILGLGWYGSRYLVASRASTTPGAAAARVQAEDDVPVGPLPRERAIAIAAAVDASNPVTRNTAVKIAAGDEGPFHVEQVARIWTFVRGRWHYVNDPQGAEYFAKASETIANEYAGDCDDFAIELAAMVTAIGGEARVVVMNEGDQGHAYAEACIRMDATEVGTRLATYYRRKWDPYLGRQRIERIHFRSTPECPLWLNLDWSAGVPGGPYSNETWAVAVHVDGAMTTLVPGVADAARDAGVPAPRSTGAVRSTRRSTPSP